MYKVQNKIKQTALTALVLILTAYSLHAEVLLIERVESKSGMSLPTKSQTMAKVQAQFGEPLSQSAPVGEPPITQWAYADFVVYFEHSHVITTVIKKSSETEIGPKAIEPASHNEETNPIDNKDN
ncbi:hypothetical protein [Marinicella rhabdoformis]|uniref:hypothetical protein n=1 Tax=Marinicella rhabdoformis TaxID=2580566 RepID=UPI0012AEB859|nr:hypothetical protein [Marinicella rhabdoformis]